MEIKHSLLRIYVAVVETGNIQDAADRVGRSPSAVSMSLKQLENLIGGALFESDRKSQVTELGAFLLDAARNQLTGHDRAMASVQAFARGEIGRVEMACVPSVASQILPGVIQDFTQKWDRVELDVRDIDTVAVIRAIERGTVEFGIAGRPSSGAVQFTPLFHDSLLVVCPVVGPLGRVKGPISLEKLAQQPLIANGVIDGSDNPGLKALSDSARLMVRNTTSLLALVKSGVGMTILPDLSVPRDMPGVRLIHIKEHNLRREVGIIHKADASLSPAANAFLAVFSEIVERNISPERAWIGNQG